MDDKQITEYLLGPNGGIFALGMIVGSFCMWIANLKLIKPWVDRAHAAELSTLLVRIEGLESRVKSLEVVEHEHNSLIRAHAKATLKCRDDAP